MKLKGITTERTTTVVATITCKEDWQLMLDKAIDTHWIEWRVDALLNELTIEDLEGEMPTYPMILTVRSKDEGGERVLTDEERSELYMRLMSKASAIDIEIASLKNFKDVIKEAKKNHIYLIASAHDFYSFPGVPKLEALEKEAERYKPDIIKFAFYVKDSNDMFDAGRLIQQRTPKAMMGMGSPATFTRMFFSRIGSVFIYGYAGERPSAPGQSSAAYYKYMLEP